MTALAIFIVLTVWVIRLLNAARRKEKHRRWVTRGFVPVGKGRWVDPALGRQLSVSVLSNEINVVRPFEVQIIARQRAEKYRDFFLVKLLDPIVLNEKKVEYLIVAPREAKKEILDPEPVSVVVSLMHDFDPFADPQNKRPEDCVLLQALGYSAYLQGAEIQVR